MPRDRGPGSGLERCWKCIYSATLSETAVCCDYLEKTGHRRGGPPGWDCTKFQMRNQRVALNQPWHDQAMELYNQGHSDETIGVKVGVTRTTIKNWRIVNGLRTNAKVWLKTKDITGDLETECLRLYFDGASDAEIADKLQEGGDNITANCIHSWRMANKLYAKKGQRAEAKYRMMCAGKWPR